MTTPYKLTVQHKGTETGDFCIYQTNDNQAEGIKSLAWFSKTAHPKTNLTFKWAVDYSFAWSEQGVLKPGVVFEASQLIDSDPNDLAENSIAFTMKENAFKFDTTDHPTKPGRLSITCDEHIQPQTASIGVAMSGNPSFACTAAPNLTFSFRPHPRYWIAFGKFEEGEVIDLNRMTEKFEIVFEPNQHEKTIQLSEKNTWVDKSI